MISKILITMALAIASVSGQSASIDSSNANTGIVYGRNHAFAITAPNGWVLDNTSGVHQGLFAVFYPKGGSWEESEAVMYVNTASKKGKDNETLQKLVDYDISQFEHEHPDMSVLKSDSLPTKDNRKAVVRLFRYSNYEAVAYIDEPAIIAMLVLTARSKAQFDSAFVPFQKLVRSYYFISENIETEH